MKARLRGAARLGIACISLFFIFGAAAKAQSLDDFGATIAAHGLIGFPEPAAYGIVALELGTGLFGLAGAAMACSYRRSAFALAGLATLFAAYALALTLRPPPVPTGCGCGFSEAPVDSWRRSPCGTARSPARSLSSARRATAAAPALERSRGSKKGNARPLPIARVPLRQGRRLPVRRDPRAQLRSSRLVERSPPGERVRAGGRVVAEREPRGDGAC